jgi:hypothetical protein
MPRSTEFDSVTPGHDYRISKIDTLLPFLIAFRNRKISKNSNRHAKSMWCSVVPCENQVEPFLASVARLSNMPDTSETRS